MFRKIFIYDPFIYLNKDGNPTKEMTSNVKWLGKIVVKAFLEKNAIKKAFKEIHFKHPDLKGFVLLF